MNNEKLLHRLMSEVVRCDSGCWLWTGCRGPKGYGRFTFEGKTRSAHVTAYELFKGDVPKGLYVCHTCDNPSCVNPDHLVAQTQSDNIKEAFTKKRKTQTGECNSFHKLTEQDVLEIMTSAASNEELGLKYNVTRTCIGAVRRGVSWGHITQRRQSVLDKL